MDGLQQYNLLTTVIHPLMFMYLLKLFCLYLALSMSIIVYISNHQAHFLDTMQTKGICCHLQRNLVFKIM